MRVLVAYEETHRAYRLAISRAIEVERPHLEVRPVGIDVLGEELNRFEPHAVICSCPNQDYPGEIAAWLEVPVEPSRGSEVCLSGDYEKTRNPGISKVLSFLDEVEERLRAGTLSEGC